ncbi:Mms22p NDAI_0J01730 [Naumovozyma dairenensis CBS 421]|uniref:Uncharacterized protein n=1 Tax=Naumovozyma dairenensis (strain ATCC 10597 / BCRC 20456 / CBS 421 / NBRC 0211 / NRRL Y-12639) TaxID=1071378 RepID=G0WGY7_NAUDC|nr:hypothetical protein NDAI_0J01730 [Naumovozyma dairenensis CBS 421]CCD27065.1 hypothetical protein NDAI_0J01730 [Naumovozyma dairenensis CBS 421]
MDEDSDLGLDITSIISDSEGGTDDLDVLYVEDRPLWGNNELLNTDQPEDGSETQINDNTVLINVSTQIDGGWDEQQARSEHKRAEPEGVITDIDNRDIDATVSISDLSLDGHNSLTALNDSRRSLRKRKAIQKNPYSLDRIKHRQLLAGYDVSAFDNIEELSIPKKGIEATPEERMIENGDLDNLSADEEYLSNDGVQNDSDVERYQDYEILSQEDKEIEEPYLPHTVPGHNGYQSDTIDNTGVSDLIADTEEVTYRGRPINLKTGYRGILPRVAWEKEIVTQSKAKDRRKISSKQGSIAHKWVARRKKIHAPSNNQEDLLLNEMIVSDSDISDGGITSHYLEGTFSQNNGEEKALEELNAYYEEKYSTNYPVNGYLQLQDSVNSENDLTSLKDLAIDSPLNGPRNISMREPILVTSQDSDTGLDIYNSSEDGNNYEAGIAEENNRGTIDAMLTKKRSESSIPAKRIKQKDKNINLKRNSKASNSKRRVTYRRRRPITVVKRSIRRSDNSRKRASSNLKHITTTDRQQREASYLLEKLDLELTNFDVGGENFAVSEGNKEKKKKKRKVLRNNSSTLRGNPVFSTIIEAVGSRYGLLKGSASKRHITDNYSENINGSIMHETPRLLSLPDILLSGKTFDPPSVVKIILTDKSYTLSKLGSSNIIYMLNEMFGYIITHGVIDAELVHISEELTKFMLLVNNSGLLEVVEKFHHDFRSKVHILKEKAKPIHFFQLAACQLMLYEVSQYTTTSLRLKDEIEHRILDNIVVFFKLLAICKGILSGNDLTYLFESYHILVTIVQLLDRKQHLWEALEKQSYSSQIALIILNLFPTRKTIWSLLRIEPSFISLVYTFKFIGYSTSQCNWIVDKDLIINLDRAFKKGRFIDFEEEMELSKKSQVLMSSESDIYIPTVFNLYLDLLRIVEITPATAERITPLADISSNDPISVLINRTNLLIILTRKCNVNASKKRFYELLRPLLKEDYLSNKDVNDSNRVCDSILNGTISLLKNSNAKGTILKPKWVKNIYQLFFTDGNNNHRNNRLQKWYSFLQQLNNTQPKSNLVFTLKLLYPSLSFMIAEKSPHMAIIDYFFKMYLSSLKLLGSTWINKNLFPLVKDTIPMNIYWIDYYCIIGEHLIKENIYTWWTFQAYNGFQDNLPRQFYFYSKITEMCDMNSFGSLKESMFTLATTHLLDVPPANNFLLFLFQLLKKEEGMVMPTIDTKSTERINLKILKCFVKCLHRNSYFDLLNNLIAKVKEEYLSKNLSSEYTNNFVNFINSNFVDEIKDSESFRRLKLIFGISNIELEKSEFKAKLKGVSNDNLRAVYLIKMLLKIYSSGESSSLEDYIDKIKSLFSSNVLDATPLDFFVSLLEAHFPLGTQGCHRNQLKAYSFHLFVRVLNEKLVESYYQVTRSEYCLLYQLFECICKNWINFESEHALECLEGNHDVNDLLVAIFRISSGFRESSHLVRMIDDRFPNSDVDPEEYASEGSPLCSLKLSSLSKEIDGLIRDNSGNLDDSILMKFKDSASSSVQRESIQGIVLEYKKRYGRPKE